jgi:hypothetical protein
LFSKTHHLQSEKKLISKQKKKPSTSKPQVTQTKRKWITFTYYSSLIRKINNHFKRTNLNLTFRTTNTIYQQLSHKPSNINPSGIYELKCNTCNKAYIGQIGSSITIRHKESIRYIRTNNATSACAMHMLDNRHEYGTVNETLKLLQTRKKGKKMNCWESLHIHTYCQRNGLITDTRSQRQQPTGLLPTWPSASSLTQCGAPNTHKTGYVRFKFVPSLWSYLI